MKTTPRAILDNIKNNWLELQKLLEQAEQACIHDVAHDLSGGWMSYDSALEKAAKVVDLDGEVDV